MNPNILLSAAMSAFCLCLLSCGGGTTNTPSGNNGTPTVPTGTNEPKTLAADSRKALFLDGVYATSTAAGQDVRNLFDDDASTVWGTQTGAGPDEGIMLYFSDRENVNVQQVELLDNGTPVKIQVYCNGHAGGKGKSGEKIAINNAQPSDGIRSLYLRFESTGSETTTKKVDGGKTVLISSFPNGSNFSLKQINLYNDKSEALRLVVPKAIKGSISASSTLVPENAYSTSNLFDARKEFVWCEGNKEKSGEGETLNFDFSSPVNITAVQIWNGYQRSDNHYTSNARAKDFNFGEKAGLQKTYTLADRKAGQRIDLAAPAKGQSFSMSFSSIYKGAKYKDMAISDILFFDGEQPFILESSLAGQYEKDLRSKINAGSPMAGLINHRVQNMVESPGVKVNQSLILRSDGTFVLYSEEKYDGAASAETIADGNWELVESTDKGGKIKVFGKWYDLSEVTDYYKGNGKKEITEIFNDVLTIDGEKIKGGKRIGTFYMK